MQEINTILELLRAQYMLYIGEKSLRYLYHFIGGYSYRLSEIRGYYRPELPGFQDFVERYYNAGLTEKSWVTLIEEHAASDADAFDLFYSLLDMFRQGD